MDDGYFPYILIVSFLIILIETIVFVILLKKKKNITVTEEDIMSMVNEGHEDGNILAKEAEMIQNIFEFSDTDVKDIMIHRKNIIGIDSKSTLNEALQIIKENKFSRYPVFKEDLDNIIGILHIKDVFFCLDDLDKPIDSIDGLIKEIVFVPETHSIDTLFSQMQSHKRHMVAVIDEYGQLSGILSMEDVLEEIVGNIEDEHDEIDSSIITFSENSYQMEGSTTIEEVEDILGIKLTEDFETLNGYLISLLGKIPDDDSSFSIKDENFEYEIKNVHSKVIEKVIVNKI